MISITREQALETFHSIAMNLEKLEYMQYLHENNFDFSSECQPDAWLQSFCTCSCMRGFIKQNGDVDICTNLGVTPIHVAQVFTKCFGNVIHCEEASRCLDVPQNIMDCFGDIYIDTGCPHMARNLMQAFKALGHKPAQGNAK